MVIVITCPTCNLPASYAGTQDGHHVYVCEHQHLTRIHVSFHMETK